MAAPQNDQITDLKKQIDDLRAKLSGLEQAQSPLQTSIAVHDKRIDDALSRIGDLNVGVSNYGILFGAIGVLITLILGVGGVLTYLNAGAKAANEAREKAAKWFAENSKSIHAEVVEDGKQKMTTVIARFEADFEELKQSAKQTVDQKVEAVETHAARVQGRMSECLQTVEAVTELSIEDRDALKVEGEQTEAIPDSQRTGKDWRTQAFAAYADNKLDDAAFYFGKAAESAESSPVDMVVSLFNRAVVLGKLGRPLEAIALYDDIDRRYGSDPAPALREHVASALFNKGVVLGNLTQHQDEIVLYDEIDRRYGSDLDAALRERVAKALVNKGAALGKLGWDLDEIATYGLIIERYGHASEPGIVEQVGMAMGNRAWTLYLTGDFSGFLAGTEQAVQHAPKDGVHLANLAFAQYLAGLGRDVVLATYGRAWQVVADRVKWDRLVLKDLRQHHVRHPQQPPVPADLIAAVAALAGGT